MNHYVVSVEEYRQNIEADPTYYKQEATPDTVAKGWAVNVPVILPDGSTGNEILFTEAGKNAILGMLSK